MSTTMVIWLTYPNLIVLLRVDYPENGELATIRIAQGTQGSD